MTKPNRPNGHGGVRKGAGRPRQYDFWEMVRIGQDCESLWIAASNAAIDVALAALKHAAEIQALQNFARATPAHERRAWLEGDGYEDHQGDMESLLHDRAGTPLNEKTEEYEGTATRVISVSAKPIRGTRKLIIQQVATQTGLSETAVDNLWQAYRRFEKDTQESA